MILDNNFFFMKIVKLYSMDMTSECKSYPYDFLIKELWSRIYGYDFHFEIVSKYDLPIFIK